MRRRSRPTSRRRPRSEVVDPRAGRDARAVTHAVVLIEAERDAMSTLGGAARGHRGRRRGLLGHRRVGLRRDRPRATHEQLADVVMGQLVSPRRRHEDPDDGGVRGVLPPRPRGDVLDRWLTRGGDVAAAAVLVAAALAAGCGSDSEPVSTFVAPGDMTDRTISDADRRHRGEPADRHDHHRHASGGSTPATTHRPRPDDDGRTGSGRRGAGTRARRLHHRRDRRHPGGGRGPRVPVDRADRRVGRRRRPTR